MVLVGAALVFESLALAEHLAEYLAEYLGDSVPAEHPDGCLGDSALVERLAEYLADSGLVLAGEHQHDSVPRLVGDDQDESANEVVALVDMDEEAHD